MVYTDAQRGLLFGVIAGHGSYIALTVDDPERTRLNEACSIPLRYLLQLIVNMTSKGG